ncbi:MAG: hypothetical protein FJ090_22185 [Deltaproteobacteria bacterium]|nr:hypothetical protein [Deltaproteobacteria bacterium]
MLLLSPVALALDYTDDFSTDQAAWSGGEVVDGVLRLTDETATLVADPVESFVATLRVRMTTEGSVAIDAGGEALTLQFSGAGAVVFAGTRLPLPPEHLRWEPAANPVIEPGADYWDGGNTLHCEVLRDPDSGTWFLYWTGEMASGYPYRQIGVATSTDGVSWERYAGNPVLTIDYDRTSIDGIHVHMPTVVRESGGDFHMYYSCYQNDVGNRLCHATSPDGLAWTPQGMALDKGGPGEFDEGSLRMPDAWIGDDGTWHLWYDGTDPTEHYGGTGYATSADGWTWTKHGEILPAESALQALSVWRSPYGLVSFHNKDDAFRMATADPADPATWTDAGEVLRKGWAAWNDGYIQAPSVWVDGSTWRMWFNGYTYTEARERIGYAEGEALPGTWLDVGLASDGAQLTATVNGVSTTVDLPSGSPLRVVAIGTAELDDVAVRGESTPTDTGGDTGADTGAADTGGDTAAADTGRDSAAEAVDEPDPEAGCGCQSGPVAAGSFALPLAAWVLVRRFSRRSANATRPRGAALPPR